MEKIMSSPLLLKRSLYYFFTHTNLLKLVFITVVFLSLFSFGANFFGFNYSQFAGDYWSTALEVVIFFMWELFVVGLIIDDLRGNSISWLIKISAALKQSMRVWWLIALLCLFELIQIPLLQRQDFHSVSIDLLHLLLYIVVIVFYGIQNLLIFFQLPLIADNRYSFSELVMDSMVKVWNNIGRLILFFILFGFVSFGIKIIFALPLLCTSLFFSEDAIIYFIIMSLTRLFAIVSVAIVLQIARSIVYLNKKN